LGVSRLVRFGVEAVFQITDGEKRVIVLIEMLSRQVKAAVAPGSVRKLAVNQTYAVEQAPGPPM
jgi:hypothetical protein